MAQGAQLLTAAAGGLPVIPPSGGWAAGVPASPPSAGWAAASAHMFNDMQGMGPQHLMGMTFSFPRQGGGPEAAALSYISGLRCGADRTASRRDHTANRSELVHVAEFSAWLAELPPHWGRSIATSTPEDIIAFMESHWLWSHGQTHVNWSPTAVASFTGVKGCLLDFEHHLDSIGREGEWNTTLGTGNPCRSSRVRLWRRSYERSMWRGGARPVAAYPVTRREVDMLVTPAGTTAGPASLPPQPAQAPPSAVRLALAARNDAVITYNHDSSQRGGEGARLRWCDMEPCPLEWAVATPSNPEVALPSSMAVFPDGDKSRQRRRPSSGGLSLTLYAADNATEHQVASKFMPMLPGLLEAYRIAGYVPGAYDPVFPLSEKGATALIPIACTRGALYQLIRRRSAARGVAPAITCHSFRRGRIVEDQAEGVPTSVTRERALGMTAKTHSYYADTTRPCRGNYHPADTSLGDEEWFSADEGDD